MLSSGIGTSSFLKIVGIYLLYDLVIPILVFTQEKKSSSLTPYKDLYINDHSSFIHNKQK